MNRRFIVAGLFFVGLSVASFGRHVVAEEPTLFGFSAESSRAER